MFLKKLLSNNRSLIEQSVLLHQLGKIPADSYVIDLDMLGANARIMAEEGKKYNLKVFAMTKQLGRNPAVMRTLMEAGITAGVCVDMKDARPMKKAGMAVGHLGHLVQVPFAETEAAVHMRPLYWTVYNREKAEAVSRRMPAGESQALMARIYGEGDTFYKGHEAGFAAEDIVETAKMLDSLPGVSFAGITTFPAQLYNAAAGTVEHTHNYATLLKAAQLLRDSGFERLEVNAPGTTSSMLFKGLAQDGVTQVEPGHGLTGTTPIHAFRDLAEQPAMAYVSEVSHIYGGRPYCFGGGMYIDPVFPPYEVKACVGSDPEQALRQQIVCDMPDPSAIDYYGILRPETGQKAAVGDTVVFGFRAQVFVTRSYVVPVSGIRTGDVRVEGIYTTDGREAGWPEW